jgi:dienelactone hydrolase
LTPNLDAVEEVKENKLSGLRPVRVTTYSVSAILLAVGLALAFNWGFRVLRAATFMYGMTYATPPLIIRAYSRAFRHSIVTNDLWIQGRGGPLELRVMAPKDSPNAPIIVLVHGFAPRGIRDGLLNAFAQHLSQSGLKVVMPDIKSEKMLRIDQAAVGDVDDAIRWSAINSGQKVSVFGISFSGGLVVSAAANPDFTDYVKTTLCISGYNSIARVGLFYLREDVRRPDSQRYSETPTPNALTLIALQYLDELVPREDIGPFTNALRATLAQGGTLEVPAVLALTESQRILLDDLLNVRTQAMRARYHTVLERHRAELDYISPMGKIRQLRGSLYVVHGYGDRRIPTEEAEWTRAEAANSRNVKVLISPWIDHSVLVPQAPFREKVRLVYFMSEMFDEAVDPVPLQPVKG